MAKKEEQQAPKPPAAKADPVFTKAQYLQSNRFTPAQRDILSVVLEEGKTYTDVQAKQALEAYLKRSVK